MQPPEALVPKPLTLLALDVVAANFEQLQPNLDDIPSKFVAAITSKLPLDLDITVTSPLVNDENYWKQVVTEHKKWDNPQIADHGLSWKQLFFETNLGIELEEFGVVEGITRKYEDEFLRPAIDATHPRWPTLYPKVEPIDAESGLPAKERFCCHGVECQAIAIVSSASGIWPALDRCKSVVPKNLQLYVETYAHANVERPDLEEVKAKIAAAAAEPLPPLPGKMPTLPPEDPDVECDGNVLREFVTPDVVAAFQATGKWPKERNPCLMCLRASQLEALTKRIKASEDYVFALSLRQFLSHLDLELVFKFLPNLSNLELTYGVRNIGMKYERSLFGMKISDAMSLAKCVKATDTLTSLILPCNMIDDALLRMLMTGLVHNQTITHLDVSHNKITNHGVRLLSKILGSKSVIMSLNLCDNEIHSDGGKYLGRALKRNDSLIDLNLRLNRLEDEGGRMLFEGMRHNASLTCLNVSSNSMRAEACRAFCNVVGRPESALVTADMSGNRMSELDVEGIRNALRDNVALTALDLRRNPDVSAASEALQDVLKITRRNELHQRRMLRK